MKKTIISTLMLSSLIVIACSNDTFSGDAPYDWNNTTERITHINDDIDDGFSTYYMHALGRVGDPMPFYDAKAEDFKVLYLQDYNNNGEFFHPYWAVSTTDCCNYRSLGEIIPTGTNSYQQDAALGTGCCIYNEKEQLYYIYYTGENAKCSNRQVIMRATSPDFKVWTKDRIWRLNGPDYGFSGTDFRDPQIFMADDNRWHMVISSNLQFADFVSDDLKNWEKVERHNDNGEVIPFNMIWDRQLECPDIFKMGDYWYLVYSEAYRSDWSRKVKYMKATSWENLKKCFDDPGANWPKDDKEGVLDSRAFYAGKTASNGTDRFIWGWCPYRTGATFYDKNVNVGKEEPNWSGALVCHRLIQDKDGNLTIGKLPDIDAKYNKNTEVKVMASKGYTNGKLTGEEAYVLYNRLGNHNHISFTVTTATDGDLWGVSFCGTAQDIKLDPTKYLDENGNPKWEQIPQDVKNAAKRFTLLLKPEWANGKRRVLFSEDGTITFGDQIKDMRNKNESGELTGIIGADGYIFPRPENNEYNVDIYTDNSVVTMYINGGYGYTQRIYGIYKNCWSINSYGGNITIKNVKVDQY